MSKLDELIQEFCPDGVEFRKVKDVYIRLKGTPITAGKMKEIANPEGNIKVFAGGKTVIDAMEKDIPKANITRVPAVLVQSRGVIDFVYYDKPFTFKNEMWAYTTDEKISVKFLYYVLKNDVEHFRDAASGMGSLPQISLPVTEEYVVPIPPLEVQREIVHVLDSFTLLIDELKSKLTAELTARKKQYSYYRDELLKPKENIPMVKIKEIATDIYRGAGIKRNQVTEDGIPCVRYGEIYTTYNTWFDECVSYTKLEYVTSPKYFEHGDILFAITGESVEDIAKSVAYVGHEKCLAGGDIVVMKHKQNPRYLAHVLNTTMARVQKSKGKVKSKVVHSNVPSIEQIEIPLPSLEVQKRYAEVLDNFEQICNDLNIGLPAEIEARQKQYEFYRDLLLTFAESNGKMPHDTTRHDTTRHDTTRHDTTRHDTTRHDTTRQSIIKLLQYVFGYAPVKLNEIATITRGGNFQKKDFVKNGEPCIHYGQMYTHFGIHADKTLTFLNEDVFAKSKKAGTGDIIMAVTSENVEDVCSCTAWMGDEDIAVSGHTAIISHNQNPKYLSYYFHSAMFFEQKRKLAHGTKVIEVTPGKLGDIEIMLPTREEQEKIVSILDRFNSLCNDIAVGLPAEIEARQKQYEYYRDKLLTFKQIENN